MSIRYRTLEGCLNDIDNHNRDCCIRLLRENRDLITKARGSKSKHHAWEGGYLDHILETMNIATMIYDVFKETGRDLPFKLEDAYLVLFLHDIEKPWKQIPGQSRLQSAEGRKNEQAIEQFREEIIVRYGFRLTEEHRNALKYAEGEKGDYDPHKNVAGPLAAFVNMCDYWGARGWPNYPKENTRIP
ncbi:MAG: hypothetical protein WCK90_05035 [archaeon]